MSQFYVLSVLFENNWKKHAALCKVFQSFLEGHFHWYDVSDSQKFWNMHIFTIAFAGSQMMLMTWHWLVKLYTIPPQPHLCGRLASESTDLLFQNKTAAFIRVREPNLWSLISHHQIQNISQHSYSGSLCLLVSSFFAATWQRNLVYFIERIQGRANFQGFQYYF